MAKSSEGASNFSLRLKLMSKIAFAEGQEKVGARTVYRGLHGQAVIIMKNHHKTYKLKAEEETFALSGSQRSISPILRTRQLQRELV